ncbi:hypothetical protein BX600DRAFT_471128 [Xylariales sp. PMI_506]|nr:hypothetical protein BX600DRAFT_471128 [Xylariales sp. PMI_506]
MVGIRIRRECSQPRGGQEDVIALEIGKSAAHNGGDHRHARGWISDDDGFVTGAFVQRIPERRGDLSSDGGQLRDADVGGVCVPGRSTGEISRVRALGAGRGQGSCGCEDCKLVEHCARSFTLVMIIQSRKYLLLINSLSSKQR